MKAALLLNGAPYCGELPKDRLIYCCDGAYRWAKGRAKIYKNIGDFDSLDEVPYPAPEEVYPSEKDFTDGEIALRKMIEEGADDIEVYGAFGGREDHFIGNLHLLYFAHMRGVNMRLISENTIDFLGSGRIDFSGFAGKPISVFPFSAPVHIIESRGLKYSYPQVLSYGECRGVSNIVEEEGASVVTGAGEVALVFINRGCV